MKLKSLFLLLVPFISTVVIGQTNYGIKAGFNLSDQYKKINPPGYPAEKLDTKTSTGFLAGVFLKHKINSQFSVTAEVNFSLLGSKTEYTRTDFIVNPDGTISGETTGYYNDKIQQIEIPVFLQYNIHQFYLGIGPSIGMKISSRIDNFQNNSIKNTYYKTMDLGVNPMIGYSIFKKIELNLRYNYGLLNIDERDYSIVKNRVLTFSVLYSLK